MKSKQILPECDRINPNEYIIYNHPDSSDKKNTLAKYHLALETAEREIEKLQDESDIWNDPIIFKPDVNVPILIYNSSFDGEPICGYWNGICYSSLFYDEVDNVYSWCYLPKQK